MSAWRRSVVIKYLVVICPQITNVTDWILMSLASRRVFNGVYKTIVPFNLTRCGEFCDGVHLSSVC